MLVLFWWVGVGKFQWGCIGGQVDRRPERKVASWVRVSAPAASAQSSTMFGPHSGASGTAGLWQCDLAWAPPGHHHRANQTDIKFTCLEQGKLRSPSLILGHIAQNPQHLLTFGEERNRQKISKANNIQAVGSALIKSAHLSLDLHKGRTNLKVLS